MKRIKLLSLIALCTIMSCQKEDTSKLVKRNTNDNNGSSKSIAGMARTTVDGPFSQWISITEANQMINSYLTSINASANDSDLHCLIFNADSLRAYLRDTSIKEMKFMLAHTKEYIDAGKFGVKCGYQSGELTMVVAGFDRSGNYIYNNQNKVMDHAKPCPSYCPSGDAGSVYLK